MPASTNTLRTIKAADLLADPRKSEAEAEVGTTPVNADSAQYIIGPLGVLEDEVTVDDSVAVLPDADTGNFINPADSVSVSDGHVIGNRDRTKYSMPGRGFITQLGATRFYGRRGWVSGHSTSCHGFVPTAPIVLGFWELGT